MPAVGSRRPIPPPPRRTPSVPTDSPTSTARPATDVSDAAAAPRAMVTIRAWVDPLVDDVGHDPRSRYVEQFWLAVLGPTATWLLRRLAAGLEAQPDGYELDLTATAKTMGLSYSVGRSSPFAKALDRCTMFGLAHQTSDGLAVRRRVPTVAHRHLRRMPDDVQAAHESWQHATVTVDQFSRAHGLAVAMLEAGDDSDAIEHQLVAVGVGDVVAAAVADNACRL